MTCYIQSECPTYFSIDSLNYARFVYGNGSCPSRLTDSMGLKFNIDIRTLRLLPNTGSGKLANCHKVIVVASTNERRSSKTSFWSHVFLPGTATQLVILPPHIQWIRQWTRMYNVATCCIYYIWVERGLASNAYKVRKTYLSQKYATHGLKYKLEFCHVRPLSRNLKS